MRIWLWIYGYVDVWDVWMVDVEYATINDNNHDSCFVNDNGW